MTERALPLRPHEARAVQEGRLGLIVRPMKPQPINPWYWEGDDVDPVPGWFDYWESGWDHYHGGPINEVSPPLIPRYPVGTVCWCQETFYLTDDGHEGHAIYDDPDDVAAHVANIREMQARYHLTDKWAAPHLRRRPSTQMPRWASRAKLRVTAVRAGRVQDLTEEDMRAAGATGNGAGPWGCEEMVEEFAGWFTNWDANPWCWLYTVERV